MLVYTDLKPGTRIVLDNEPYVVLEYSFSKKQRQKATVQTKIKNLISGKIVERAFHPSDSIKEADIDAKDVKFLYSRKGEFWFCELDNPAQRFKLEENTIGGSIQFLKENSIVKALVFLDKIININLPVKVDLRVAEAPPAVRGNTAQGVVKQIKTETGAVLAVPIFINEGDIIRVNVEKGEYVERVSKAK